MHDGRNRGWGTLLLRCEDLKQEREAVVDCMVELESEFLTASDEKKVVMILDQACRNPLANPLRSCGSVDSVIRTNNVSSFQSIFRVSLYAWCYHR